MSLLFDPTVVSPPTTYRSLRPPVRRIPKRTQQYRHMIMLALGAIPHHKLDLDLWKERLDPPLPKVTLRVKGQAVSLVALALENDVQPVGAKR